MCLASIGAHSPAAQPVSRGLRFADPAIRGINLTSTVWGDFNRDSRLDAAVTQLYGRYDVLLGRGTGVWEPIATYQLPSDPGIANETTLAFAADQDRDGILDLVWRRWGQVFFAAGVGGGQFAPALRQPSLTNTLEWRAHDIDGDGRLDFVDRDDADRSVRVFAGVADGSFREVVRIPLDPQLRWDASSVAVGNLDGIGLSDIALTGWDPVNRRLFLSCFWNLGSFQFTEQRFLLPAEAPLRFDAIAGDDGTLDDLVGGAASGLLTVVRVAGREMSLQPVPLGDVGVADHLIANVDIDADGRRDLILARDSAVSIAWGRQDGSRTDVSGFTLPGATGAPVALDIDGDGIPDIAATAGHEGLPVLYGSAVDRRLNGAASCPTVYRGSGVAVAELNGDGHADVVAGDLTNARVAVFLGDGAGRLRPGKTYPAPVGYGVPPVVGDLDGDGRADLAVGSLESAGNAAVIFGDGNGGFDAARVEVAATDVVALARIAGEARPALVARTGGTLRLARISPQRELAMANIAECAPTDRVFVVDLDAGAGSSLVIAAAGGGAFLLRQTPSGMEPWATVPNTGMPILGATAIESSSGDHRFLVLWEVLAYWVYDAASGGDLPLVAFGGGLGSVTSVQALDFDRDGLTDLAVTRKRNYSDPGLVVVDRNTGDGSLAPYASALAGPSSTLGAGAGDLDGDGWGDVVVVTDAGVETLRNVEGAPRIRAVDVRAAGSPGAPARLVVNLQPALSNAQGVVSIYEGTILLHSEQPRDWYDFATIIWESPLLTTGSHDLTLVYEDQFAGVSTAGLRVGFPPRLPRPRQLRRAW